MFTLLKGFPTKKWWLGVAVLLVRIWSKFLIKKKKKKKKMIISNNTPRNGMELGTVRVLATTKTTARLVDEPTFFIIFFCSMISTFVVDRVFYSYLRQGRRH
jgi:hypothetical protein